MRMQISQNRSRKDVLQFSVFAENKVGCLNLILQLLLQNGVHIMAMSCIDQTDCAVLRIIPNYPETTEKVLSAEKISFSKCAVLALEFSQNEDLVKITQSLSQAEININYLYPLICRPESKSGIVLACDEPELAPQVLSCYGVKVLDLDDLSR